MNKNVLALRFLTLRHLCVFLLTAFVISSCSKDEDTSEPFIVDFEYTLNQLSVPAELTINNKTTGATTYSWTFEGATPAYSTEKTPSTLTYNIPGNFTITLTASNGKEDKVIKKTVPCLISPAIAFGDTVLERRIRAAIGKPTGPVTRYDASKVTILNLKYDKGGLIRNIDSLEYFTSLKKLGLANNNIINIKSLEKLLDLQELDLYNNNVSDIGPLKNLTKLTTINLWSNSVSDLAPLKDLTLLVDLNIGANLITDLSPIENLTSLVDLWLNANYNFYSTNNTEVIKKFTKLKTLGLTACNVTDISFVKDLTNLEELLFESNKVTDISSLKSLTKIVCLYMSYNKITDITPIETMYNNGCFRLRSRFGKNIQMLGNNCSITTGTENRRVVDFLSTVGVVLNWQTGNIY